LLHSRRALVRRIGRPNLDGNLGRERARQRVCKRSVALAAEDAGELFEERFDRPLVLIFDAAPKEPAFGIRELGIEAMDDARFLLDRVEIEAVRSIESL